MKTCRSSAFTLIELLLVMVILTVLAGVVVPRIGQYSQKARISKATTDIANLETAIGAFQIDCGRFPTVEEGLSVLESSSGISGWSGPYVKLVPLDPWDTPYQYKAPGENLPLHFDLYSLGPDKVQGIDDVTNWQRKGPP